MNDLEEPLTGGGNHDAPYGCREAFQDPDGFPQKVLMRCGVSTGVALFLTCCLVGSLWMWAYKHCGYHQTLPWYEYAVPYEAFGVSMAVTATAISVYHLVQHVLYNNNTWKVKSHALIIISMVPVYSICSGAALLGTMSKDYIAIPLSAFREFYEALVLVAFLQFIAEFWGGTVRLAAMLDTDAMIMSNVFPTAVDMVNIKLRCILEKIEPYKNALKDLRVFPIPRMPGSHYVAWTYIGALQYAVVMWLYVVVMLTLWTTVLFFDIDTGIVVKVETGLKGVKGLSNLIAMYNLLILFEYLRESENTHVRMNKIKPISKFVCIKLIVIFSLWQEFLFSLFGRLGLLPTARGYSGDWTDQEKNAKAVVNFLVCIEMMLFAWWHRYAYPCDEAWDPQPEDLLGKMDGSSRYESRRPMWLRVNVIRLTDDIGYLLNNRVRGQFHIVRTLREAKTKGCLDAEMIQVIQNNWKYFELDNKHEASLTQLQYLLYNTKFAKNWEEAGEMLKKADTDGTKRIGIEELFQLIEKAEGETSVCLGSMASTSAN